jgi:hypothetical protein
MLTSYTISAIRYWIETKEKTKKGLPVRKPNDVRKIYIQGDFITTECFRATVVKRHGERYISVKAHIKPKKPWWDKTAIKEAEMKWMDYDRLSIAKFEQWLAKLKIPCPAAVVSELLTTEPLSREDGEAELSRWLVLSAA